MTPERMAELTARWARFYTRGLPAPIAERRIAEIDSDLRDQIAHERANGIGDRRIALSIFSRAVRGVFADASWRRRSRPSGTGLFRSPAGILCATGLVLLAPLVAMQFTDEVAWTPADFAVAATLLAGTGFMYRFATRTARNNPYRIAVCAALAASLLLVWASLAVGIIGEEGDRADLMYGGVLTVGVVGAVLARFRPRGMTRALLAMALTQALVTAIALIAGKHQAPTSSVLEILAPNGFFAALFVASALLFRLADRRRSPAGVP